MGKRGPKPTPKDILQLRGSRRGNRTGDEPIVDRTPPEAPDWLTGMAREVWHQMLELLKPSGVLAAIDFYPLARYCVQWSRWRQAEEFIARYGDGIPIKDAAGRLKAIRPFPQVKMARDLNAALSKFEIEFGMTPSSRSRIVVTPSAAPKSAIMDFLANK